MRRFLIKILVKIRREVRKAADWWSRQQDSTRALPGYLLRVFNNYGRYGASQAAALSYYAIFSVFPLTLLLAIGLNSLLGPTVSQDQIASGLRLFLPENTVQFLQENISQALSQRDSFTLVAFVTLVWAGSGLFSNLTHSLEVIFLAPRRRSLWRQRLLAVGMVLILILLIVVSFVTSGLLRLITAVFFTTSSIWITIGIVFLPLSLNLVIFILLFRFVPAVEVRWHALLPAAALGAIGWELTKGLLTWYLENLADFGVVYGSIATVIVLLLSGYLTAVVLIISAELCARLNEWFKDYQTTSEVIVKPTNIVEKRLFRYRQDRG
jgi:membrane protein